MSKTESSGVETMSEGYSGSPTSFAFFSVLGAIFLVLTVLIFPNIFAVLTGLISVVSFGFLPSCVAVNKEWEEAIVLRLGKFQRLVGPGFFFKWPLAETFLKQDMRIITLDVARQEAMTKDNISVSIDAVVFMKVMKTKDSLVNIQNVWNSVMKYAQTTMRDVVGNVELDALLARRDEVADRIAEIVERETKEWGVDIISVNLQNVELPQEMKRVMARQAEAEREKRAVIIKSEGELTAAENLEQAVSQMSNRALYLRTLSSLEDISFDQSNTIVFALPMDVTKGDIIGLAALAEANRSMKKSGNETKDE